MPTVHSSSAAPSALAAEPTPPPLVGDPDDPACLLAVYEEVRATTEALARPLTDEDQVVQSMPDVSPTKWHRAHTTWFFETFVLAPHLSGHLEHHPGYGYLFNSYYEGVGPRHPRPDRGLLTRPSVSEVGEYRRAVDDGTRRLLSQASELEPSRWSAISAMIELGLHHEQQHQELLLMDIKHVLSSNPLKPAYRLDVDGPPRSITPGADGADGVAWVDFEGGLVEIGHRGDGFAFDNEGPRHRVHLEPFRLADRLVTAGDWLAFMDDGGYRRPELWLSEGWATVQEEGWDAPSYWEPDGDGWSIFTLGGPRSLSAAEPVTHVSLFEADAYARWRNARLPTEAEWEHAAATTGSFTGGNDLTSDALHPLRAVPFRSAGSLHQLHGDGWEWTSSQYGPYPGFAPAPGAVGEYNGKFMCNQHVLRGGSCVTPARHVRPTYRNFFPARSRWMFSGVRLASDAVTAGD